MTPSLSEPNARKIGRLRSRRIGITDVASEPLKGVWRRGRRGGGDGGEAHHLPCPLPAPYSLKLTIKLLRSCGSGISFDRACMGSLHYGSGV